MTIEAHRRAVDAAIRRADAATTRTESDDALSDAQAAAAALTRAVREAGYTGEAMLDQTPEWGHISDAALRAQRKFGQGRPAGPVWVAPHLRNAGATEED